MEIETAINRQQLLTARSIRTLTELGIPTTPLSTSWEALTQYTDAIRDQFMSELLFAAPHDFSCYCEYISPDEPPSSALHQLFTSILTNVETKEIQRLLVSVPPGAAKSEYFSRRFPTWFLGRNPAQIVLSAGHSQTFVTNELGKKCRGIINSDAYKDVFPNIKLAKDSKAADAWGLEGYKGGYKTKGIGQGISGYRANIGILDDPFASRADASSQLTRDNVFNWYTDDYQSRLLPNSPCVVVCTRWHIDDLSGRLEQMTKDGIGIPYQIINIPAILPADNVLGLPESSSIWPEFYTKEFYLNIKSTLSPTGWSSLYMGNPIASEGGVFEESFIHHYDELPKLGKEGANIRRITVSVDSAQKTTERHDWTVLTVWIQTMDGKHYLADVIRRRVEFNALVKLVDDVSSFWRATTILVEDKGSGTSLLQVRGPNSPTPSLIPYIAISTKNQTKEFRFDACTPLFNMGHVLLPHKATWLTDYINELLSFPDGKFDDSVDSTSQYLNWSRDRARLGTRKLRTR